MAAPLVEALTAYAGRHGAHVVWLAIGGGYERAVLGSTDAGDAGARAPPAQRADEHRRRARRHRRGAGRDRPRRHPGRALRGLGARARAGRRDPAPPPPGGRDAVGGGRVPVPRCTPPTPAWTSTSTPTSSTPPRSATATAPRSGGTGRAPRRAACRAADGRPRAAHRRARAPTSRSGSTAGRGELGGRHQPPRRRGVHRPARGLRRGRRHVPVPRAPRRAAASTASGSRSSAAWSSRRTPTTARTCSTRRSPSTPARAGWARSASAPTTRCRAFTGRTLLDEKIGGTVHLALGSSYPETGGTNVSALHWDLVCDLRGGGELLLDGRAIQRDGAFVPELALDL